MYRNVSGVSVQPKGTRHSSLLSAFAKHHVPYLGAVGRREAGGLKGTLGCCCGSGCCCCTAGSSSWYTAVNCSTTSSFLRCGLGVPCGDAAPRGVACRGVVAPDCSTHSYSYSKSSSSSTKKSSSNTEDVSPSPPAGVAMVGDDCGSDRLMSAAARMLRN